MERYQLKMLGDWRGGGHEEISNSFFEMKDTVKCFAPLEKNLGSSAERGQMPGITEAKNKRCVTNKECQI